MDYLVYLICFLAGILFAKVFRFFLNVGYSVTVFKAAEATSLKMLAALTEDIAFIRELKHHSMAQVGMSEDDILLIKVIDQQTLKNWKDAVIKKIINSYPHSYRNSIPYDDWKGALEHLDKLNKKKGVDI